MAAWAEQRNLLALPTVELEQKAVLFGCVFAACQPSEDCDAEKQASACVLLGFADRQIYNKISLEQLVANVKLAVEIAANLPGGLTRAQLTPPLETPDA